MSLRIPRALADAVLLEGYALYPYRASAPKNRFRWTFGVLAPRAWSEAGGCEPWWLEAQVLVAGTPAGVRGQARFFQVERRRVLDPSGRDVAALEIDGQLAVRWEGGVERTIDFEVDEGVSSVPIAIHGYGSVEAGVGGKIVRECRALAGRIVLRREPVATQRPLTRVTVRIENDTPWTDTACPREEAMLGAFASTHIMLEVDGAELLSAIDPPSWAASAAAGCRSVRTFPALVGRPGASDAMLCAPFALQDHAQVAPESVGDLCDATEIDELLVLRTRTLGDDEKRQARATDPRAAQIVERADALEAEALARMHGATRDLCEGEMVPRARPLGVGSKVKLLPAKRRTDAQDILYAGHVATVADVREDVDGTMFLAVTIDDDPAADLHDWYGRYHYYRLDEVEPL